MLEQKALTRKKAGQTNNAPPLPLTMRNETP